MEYVEFGGGRGDQEDFGRNLAHMHLAEPAVGACLTRLPAAGTPAVACARYPVNFQLRTCLQLGVPSKHCVCDGHLCFCHTLPPSLQALPGL